MIKNIHENRDVLQQIEWNILENKLLELSFFSSTFDQILTPLINKKQISFKLKKSSEFLDIYDHSEFKDFLVSYRLELCSDGTLQTTIERSKKSASISFSDLNETAKMFELYAANFKLLLSLGLYTEEKETYYGFSQKFNRLFIKPLRVFVDKDGVIDYLRHPKLKVLFHEQIQIEEKIRASIHYTLNDIDTKNRLQYSSWDIINDRYVIPIKNDAYTKTLGRIISRSETGQTLYVEPTNISTLNYKRLEILIDIARIVSQLELEYSQILYEFTDKIQDILNFFIDIDELYTKFLFYSTYNLSAPVLVESKSIDMKSAFHPLIVTPVTNDILIPNDKAGLIISGPNTGGKTATLKTIALTQVLLKFGLFVPATDAAIFPYDNIYYFGNDQQDLESGLSSFSAEVKNYTHLIDSLGDKNLILIDEIFNSTSSEEASALALAFFELIEQTSDSHIIVSSHHQTLKTLLHQRDSYISTHVGFNLSTNQPTYKLHYGSPGSSHALRIFELITKNSINLQSLAKRALSFLDNKAIHYEKVLDSVARKENELDKVLLENRNLQVELKNQKKSMDGIFTLKLEEKIRKAELKIEKVITSAQIILENVNNNKITKKNKLVSKSSELKSELRNLAPKKEELKKDYSNLSIPNEIIVGEQYFSTFLGKTVIVNKINSRKKIALVATGNISLNCPIESLRDANKSGKIYRPKISTDLNYTNSHSAQLEYDCRGMRLEEFITIVENASAHVLTEAVPYIVIIHGHGTGVLKKWLRDHIRKTKGLTIDLCNSANDGESRIILN